MTKTNPLKNCDSIENFNKFVDKLERVPVGKKNGHTFRYIADDGTEYSFTRNQIIYRFNECRKQNEDLIFNQNNRKAQKDWNNLEVDVNEGLEKINALSKGFTSSRATKVKDAWFAITHKGFKADKKLQKIEGRYPKNLHMIGTKIARSLKKEPSFEELKQKFQEEGYDLSQLMIDPTSLKILNQHSHIKKTLLYHEIYQTCEKIAVDVTVDTTVEQLTEAFKKHGLSLDKMLNNQETLKILFKNDSLRPLLYSYGKSGLLQPDPLNEHIKNSHLEFITEKTISKYELLNLSSKTDRDLLREKVMDDFAYHGRNLKEVIENPTLQHFFEKSNLNILFQEYKDSLLEKQNSIAKIVNQIIKPTTEKEIVQLFRKNGFSVSTLLKDPELRKALASNPHIKQAMDRRLFHATMEDLDHHRQLYINIDQLKKALDKEGYDLQETLSDKAQLEIFMLFPYLRTSLIVIARKDQFTPSMNQSILDQHLKILTQGVIKKYSKVEGLGHPEIEQEITSRIRRIFRSEGRTLSDILEKPDLAALFEESPLKQLYQRYSEDTFAKQSAKADAERLLNDTLRKREKAIQLAQTHAEGGKDFIDQLEITRSSNIQELKTAVRKILLTSHPDKHVGKTDQSKQEALFKFASEFKDLLENEANYALYLRLFNQYKKSRKPI